jgi:spermidine synthase
VIEGDGAAFISKTAISNASIADGVGAKNYDLVIFDAFVGNKPPKELFSEGMFKLTRQIMSSDGILALNMLNEKPGVNSMQTHLAKALLNNIFKHTKIVNCQMGWNCILLASDRKL